MILIIDNYDSFVFNIARYFVELGEEIQVVRNDAIDVSGVVGTKADALVLSPGPCGPGEAGQSLALIEQLHSFLPILGICLGHQCIGKAFGGHIARAREPMHGRASMIHHDGIDLFEGLPDPLRAGRYHSLIVELDTNADSPLVVTARSPAGEIMGLAHRSSPTFGVQFHPESVLTEYGHELLSNFLALARGRKRHAMA
jgi:para-aminobenzoate synthetase component 2